MQHKWQISFSQKDLEHYTDQVASINASAHQAGTATNAAVKANAQHNQAEAQASLGHWMSDKLSSAWTGIKHGASATYDFTKDHAVDIALVGASIGAEIATGGGATPAVAAAWTARGATLAATTEAAQGVAVAGKEVAGKALEGAKNFGGKALSWTESKLGLSVKEGVSTEANVAKSEFGAETKAVEGEVGEASTGQRLARVAGKGVGKVLSDLGRNGYDFNIQQQKNDRVQSTDDSKLSTTSGNRTDVSDGVSKVSTYSESSDTSNSFAYSSGTPDGYGGVTGINPGNIGGSNKSPIHSALERANNHLNMLKDQQDKVDAESSENKAEVKGNVKATKDVYNDNSPKLVDVAAPQDKADE